MAYLYPPQQGRNNSVCIKFGLFCSFGSILNSTGNCIRNVFKENKEVTVELNLELIQSEQEHHYVTHKETQRQNVIQTG